MRVWDIDFTTDNKGEIDYNNFRHHLERNFTVLDNQKFISKN